MKDQDKKKRIPFEPANYLAPLPVCLLSTAAKDGPPNIMTVAWNGTVNSRPPMISVSVTKERYSHALLMDSKEFCLNVPDLSLAKATDYCGVKSFREVDKFKELSLTPELIEPLQYAPSIKEAPISLACKLHEVVELGSHDLFIGEIVGVRIWESLFDKKGALHLEDAGLIAYVHGEYFSLGDWLGFFGWSVARPEVLRKRQKEAKKRP